MKINTKILSNILIQQSSAAEEAKILYSTLVEDLETVGCFLADQVIGELPRNTKTPEIDFLSIGSQAQSTSL